MKNSLRINRAPMAKKNFTYSSCHDVTSTLSMTVGSPSAHRRSTMLKLVSVLVLILTIGVGNAWGTDVAVGDTLIIENFKDGSSQTDWSKTSANYSSTYSSITMKVSGDASSISLSASNAKVSTATAANMAASHVWLNKNTEGYIEIDNIPLHNVTKFQAHWAQSAKVAVTFYYKFNGDASWTSGGASTAAANADATSNAITVTSGKTSVSIKFQRADNGTNQRLDKVHLVVTQVAATKTLSSIAITTQPTNRAYLVGQTFSKTGAVVTATYSDATTANVSASATWTPTTGLVSGSNTITASYTEGGVTKTATTTVTGYTVTVQVKDVDGNTLSGVGAPTASATGASITALASGNNYVFKRWVAVTAAGTSFADASNRSTTLSGTPTGDVTIKAEYYKPITITYKANSSTFITQTYGYGGTLAFPASNPDGATYSCTGKTFVGWVGEANKDYSDASTPPTYATAGGSVTTDATYYAVFATAGAGGAGEKIKITPTNSELPAAGTYNATATSFTIGDYTFKHNSWCKSADPPATYNIQAKKNIGVSVYNVDAFENKIDRVIVYQTGTARAVTITGSYYYDDDEAEAEGETYSEEAITPPSTAATMSFSFSGKNHRYFYMSTPGNAVYMDSIVIYTRNSISYTDYVTKCCTPIGYVGGSVVFTDPTTAVLTWNAMSNVDATTPYTITYRTGSDDFDDDNVGSITTNGAGKKTCTITGLSCNTSYDFKIEVTAASNYCDKDTTMTGKNSGTWSVTSTIVNGTKTDVPTTACGDYTATFAATSGYHFPAKANVSVTGASDFSWNSSTGVLSIDGEDITGNISISITCPPDACSDWGFYYGTDKVADWAYECFTKVKPADATDHEWQTDEIALPNKPNWYVDNATEDDGKKKVVTWGDLYFAMSQGSGTRPMVGTATGATGKIRIYDNWDWNNRAAGFLPTGYMLKFGSNEYPFTFVASSEYRTGIINLNSTTYADAVSVGIEDGNGDYVSTGNTEALRHIFFVPSAAWKTSSAKFCIHYWDGGSLNARSDYMSAVPGKSGWYEGWLPAAATGFQFERQNPAGDSPTEGNRWTAGADQTLQSNKNCYTMTASGGESDWDGTITTSLYTSKGKFRMWDNSTSKNWYVTFYPHYVLHYDANSGSGEPADQSVALDASPCQLTVSSTAPTRSNYTFLGWNKSSSATSPDGDWDGGDTHAMTGDVTLYAVWAANHTLSYSLDGGDGSCSGGTYYTGQSFTACNNPGDKTGHSFTGWLGSNSTSYTAGTTYSMPDADLTLTAQWSVNSYDVTLTTNGGTINAGNVTSYTYGVGATLPTNVTRDGYRFDGWFTDDGVWSDQVTAISTTATGDKTYYAKWTAIYTVTWHVNGSTYNTGVVDGNSHVVSGEKISDVPTAPADNTLNNCANKFMGWSAKDAGSTAKTTSYYDDLFTDVEGSPTISDDIDFYAVFAEEVNSGTYSDGTSHEWLGSKGYSDWGGSATYSWLRNNNATIPTHYYTPAYGVKKVVLNVRQSNATGSNTVAVTIGGTAVGTTKNMTEGSTNTNFDMTFDHGTGTPLTGEVRIVATNTSANTTGQGTFFLNSITLYEGTPDKEFVNYVTECAANQVRVSYNFNGGYGSACTEGVTTKTASYTVCSTTPTKNFYDFTGWNDGTSTYAAGATGYNLQANTTFTAQWTPTTYNITYELDGGTNSGSNPATYNVTTATITLQNPTKGHDRFEGWYSTYSAGVYSDPVTEIPLGSHGNITLYAKWTERHEIVFDYSEGDGGTTTTIYRADDENLEDAVAGQGSKPANPSAPSACSSKVFVGWSESEIDDETDTRPGDLTNATGTVSGDKHYYAVWATSTSGSKTLVMEITRADFDGSYHDGAEQSHTSTAVANDGSGATLSVSWKSVNVGDFSSKIQVKDASGAGFWNTTDLGSISSVSITTGNNITHFENTSVHPTSTSGTTKGYFTVTKSGGTGTATKVTVTFTKTVSYYIAYSTSCCATKVTLSQNSPEHGTIAFGKTSVGTCGGDKEVSLTITPAAGYQLSSYEVATGNGKVAAKSVSPEIALNNNSSAAQNITLTFAEDANGAYDVTAAFSLMTVTSWTWTLNSAAIPDPLNLYVGQTARFDVAYTPDGVVSGKKTYTREKNDTYINWVGGQQSAYSTISGRTSTGANTTPVIFTHADGPSTTVNVKVLPLPLVHFGDIVHNVSFDDVVATLSDNTLSPTKTTPTHADFDGATKNTCEEEHLHLVGWIREDWPALVNYLNSTGAKPTMSEITTASDDASGNAYFFTPGASINTQTFNGVTFYAVWAKVE